MHVVVKERVMQGRDKSAAEYCYLFNGGGGGGGAMLQLWNKQIVGTPPRRGEESIYYNPNW
jgi:hypothetical protein